MPFLRINNKKAFLLDEIPQIHPASSAYLKFWREQKRRCIEGFWAQDTEDEKEKGMWRFMPPQLYFYVNLTTILQQDEDGPVSAPKKRIRPMLRDVEWEVFYNWLEARGFSGFIEDEKYTCCRLVNDPNTDRKFLPKSCFNSKDELKEFVPAKKYLRQLFDTPMGLPIYDNEAKNLMLLGSRGFGKSYLTALGVILHEWIFDGAKVYDKESIEHPYTVEVFVGAGLSSKSSETLNKMKIGYRELLGAYAKGTIHEKPHPFFKQVSGSLEPNNMRNPWRHEYKKKLPGRDWESAGTLSKILHGIYTIENPEAAAGTRPSVAVVEEVGLLPNTLRVHGSNDAAQKDDVRKFGSAFYIGTGGNIKKIVETKIIFYSPDGFDFLEFDDEWENKGKIGMFMPAYYAFNKFKDENGNTDVDAAIKYIENRRKEKLESGAPFALEYEMMNYPIVPSEMFLNIGVTQFPVADIVDRLGVLETSRTLLNSSWKVEFSIEENGEIKYRESNKKIIRDFPVRTGIDVDGAIEIYEQPKRDTNGKIFDGRYIAGCDPIDDDGNTDITLSLQSTFVLDTWTDRIVAEYTARTRLASEYYEQQRRLLIYYNALMNYEQQKKGLFAHYKNMNSLYLLCPSPSILKDQKMIKKSGGVGNTKLGTYTNANINEWADTLITQYLLTPAYEKEDGTLNIHTVRSVGLLKELSMYDGSLNCDRISALRMLMVLREEVRPRIQRSLTTDKGDQEISKNFWSKNFDNYKNRNGLIIRTINLNTLNNGSFGNR